MTTPTYQPTSTRTASDMSKLLAKQASSMKKLLANPSNTDTQHPTLTPSSMKKLLPMQILGMNKLIANASTPSLIQNELNCVKFTFDTDGVPFTNDIAINNNNAGNNNENVDKNNNNSNVIVVNANVNGIVDTTSICSDVIDDDIHNNNKGFYFGTFDKVHYGDDVLPSDSKDSNSADDNKNTLNNMDCSILPEKKKIPPSSMGHLQVPHLPSKLKIELLKKKYQIPSTISTSIN